jgi:hypothetical protein
MHPMSVRPANWAETETKLRRIPQYRDEGAVRVQLACVPPEDVRPMCLLVRAYRLGPVEELMAACRHHAVELFRGVWVRGARAHDVLIPPPIVEVHAGRKVIVDGLHRLYCALRLGLPAVWVALVSGVAQELPADVVAWEEVKITERRTSRWEKFRNLDETLFREVKRWIDEPM